MGQIQLDQGVERFILSQTQLGVQKPILGKTQLAQVVLKAILGQTLLDQGVWRPIFSQTKLDQAFENHRSNPGRSSGLIHGLSWVKPSSIMGPRRLFWGPIQLYRVVWRSYLESNQARSRGPEDYFGSNPARSRSMEVYLGSDLDGFDSNYMALALLI